jgi:hypothetical protein
MNAPGQAKMKRRPTHKLRKNRMERAINPRDGVLSVVSLQWIGINNARSLVEADEPLTKREQPISLPKKKPVPPDVKVAKKSLKIGSICLRSAAGADGLRMRKSRMRHKSLPTLSSLA